MSTTQKCLQSHFPQSFELLKCQLFHLGTKTFERQDSPDTIQVSCAQMSALNCLRSTSVSSLSACVVLISLRSSVLLSLVGAQLSCTLLTVRSAVCVQLLIVFAQHSLRSFFTFAKEGNV